MAADCKGKLCIKSGQTHIYILFHLVSRMRDGAQVILAEEKILHIMQRHIDKLEEMGCDIVVFLCTGKFPEFHHKNIHIYPQKLVHKITEIMVEEGTLGIVVPSKDQVDTIEKISKNSFKTKN
ncbi:AroM family protein [Clostridium thailandense]|uniref:AroM family protein n=1 Tax=Clostridium thailandense TaxID=2794346 RepID=UPI0039893F7E